jgi:hypothetical protein
MPNNYGDPISIDRACNRYEYDQWVVGTTYSGIETDPPHPYADQVRNGSVDYLCILSHVSTATDEPGVGVNWETYWEISYRHYTKDDSRYPEGRTYTDFMTGRKERGYSWKLCPFSREWRAKYADVNGGNGYYRTVVSGTYQFLEVPSSEQTWHTTTNGHMRGQSKYYICDDSACYYYTTVNSGTKFKEV